MVNFFKNLGKGVGYFFAFPGIIVAIAIYAVFGLLVFIFQFFKLIVLFFTGRTLFSDLKEDIELKALLDKSKSQDEDVSEDKQEEKKEDNPMSLYPSDSPVYGSGYQSPLFEDKKEEAPREPEIIDEPLEEQSNEEGGEY